MVSVGAKVPIFFLEKEKRKGDNYLELTLLQYLSCSA